MVNISKMDNICRFFLQGICRYGDKCRYVHDKSLCKPCNPASTNENKKDGANCKDKRQNKHRKPKNTENFSPDHTPPEMRIVFADSGLETYNKPHSTRDVVVVKDLFCKEDNLEIYESLLKEIKTSNVNQDKLWKSWHGDTHWIADDKLDWKKECPTFTVILNRIKKYFNMDIKATRFNLYKDSSEWKPFHHDAAAVKKDKAKTQNVTVAVSFGAERDVAFEHSKSKTVISIPQPNGAVYTFGKDVNIIWKHGIPQLPVDKVTDKGRISIIAWGWIDQVEL